MQNVGYFTLQANQIIIKLSFGLISHSNSTNYSTLTSQCDG